VTLFVSLWQKCFHCNKIKRLSILPSPIVIKKKVSGMILIIMIIIEVVY